MKVSASHCFTDSIGLNLEAKASDLSMMLHAQGVLHRSPPTPPNDLDKVSKAKHIPIGSCGAGV